MADEIGRRVALRALHKQLAKWVKQKQRIERKIEITLEMIENTKKKLKEEEST